MLFCKTTLIYFVLLQNQSRYDIGWIGSTQIYFWHVSFSLQTWDYTFLQSKDFSPSLCSVHLYLIYVTNFDSRKCCASLFQDTRNWWRLSPCSSWRSMVELIAPYSPGRSSHWTQGCSQRKGRSCEEPPKEQTPGTMEQSIVATACGRDWHWRS